MGIIIKPLLKYHENILSHGKHYVYYSSCSLTTNVGTVNGQNGTDPISIGIFNSGSKWWTSPFLGALTWLKVMELHLSINRLQREKMSRLGPKLSQGSG